MAKSHGVEDRNQKFKELEKNLKILNGSYIKVGIQEGTVTTAQTKGFHVKPAGLSMAEIGYVNEYGSGHIPARSFIGSTMNEKEGNIVRFIDVQVNDVMRGRITALKALNLTGLYVESLIKQKIRAITSPPNSPVTIAMKGSSKPLIDFGQMINSIKYVVLSK